MLKEERLILEVAICDLKYQPSLPLLEARTYARGEFRQAQAERPTYDAGTLLGRTPSLTHTITLIPGDGTGPEIVEATRRAIEATGVKIQWDIHEIGMAAMAKQGTPFPKDALESIRRNRVALKGPLTTELGTGFRSVNVALRKEFDLYANLRPAKTYPGVPAPRGDIDLVVVRENIEDLYAGIEFDVDSPEEREVQETIERLAKTKIREHSALAIKAISVFGSRRIVKFAFDYARANKRRKVTAVHRPTS